MPSAATRPLLTSMQHTGLWAAFDITPCTHLETLRLDWHHIGDVPADDALEQDLHVCAAIAYILAATPLTLRTLALSLPYAQHPDTLTDSLRCVAPRIEQAVDRFPGLKTVSVRVTRSFAAEECMKAVRGVLPAGLLDSGVLQIVHRCFRVFCKL